MHQGTTGVSNLDAVRELHIILNAEASRKANYPLFSDVKQMVSEGRFCEELLDDAWDLRFDDGPFNVFAAARCLVVFTATFVDFLTHNISPKVDRIRFSGIRELCGEDYWWYDQELKALPEDCLYLQKCHQVVKNRDMVFEYDGVREEPGRCVVCMAEWTEGHWSPENELNICPCFRNGDLEIDQTMDPRSVRTTIMVHIAHEINS